MQTVLMAIAVVKSDDRILLRKMNPKKNPYAEPWGLFGAKIAGEGSVEELLSEGMSSRWGFGVKIAEKLWWDEDIKVDHDGETKRFVYIDTLCSLSHGDPTPEEGESLEWVAADKIAGYELNSPTRILLGRLGLM